MRCPSHLADTVLADADVVIDFFNGKEQALGNVTTLVSTHRLVLSTITLFELRSGVTGEKRLAAINKLASLARLLPFGPAEAASASAIYTHLKQAGKLIGISDILVAGSAAANNLPVYTRNQRHFSRIPELVLWSPGKSDIGGA